MPNWWVLAALWIAGTGALLAATASLLPRLDGAGARSVLGRSAVLVAVGLLCVLMAGHGLDTTPAPPAPAAAE